MSLIVCFAVILFDAIPTLAKSYIPSWSAVRNTGTSHPLAIAGTFRRYSGPRYVLIQESGKKIKARKNWFREFSQFMG